VKNSTYNNAAIADQEFSFSREYLLTSSSGTYTGATISGCNTRKYHGLLVCHQPDIDDDNHVLLSNVDELIRIGDKTILFGTHQYPSAYHPEGFKHAEEFTASPYPKWTYKAEGVRFTKEILLNADKERVFVKYTILDAPSAIELHLIPFIAFRNIHRLSKANLNISRKYETIENGIKTRLYKNYSNLYLQLSRQAEFVAVPDWYYNMEYQEEKNRGYDYQEDLFVPGYFRLALHKGNTVIVSASLHEEKASGINRSFNLESARRPALNTFEGALKAAAKQFIITQNSKTDIKAGYFWFNSWGRDTFIALPGLTFLQGDDKTFKAVVKNKLGSLKAGLFPNVGSGKSAAYNSADASLWFIWALQQYTYHEHCHGWIWPEYGKYLKDILNNYRKGTLHNIHMDEDGLLYAGETGYALTWMDAVVEGKPVTPRIGKAVEINALWYNAICFCLEVALIAGDHKFFHDWEKYPELIRSSYEQEFWDKEKGYLADVSGLAGKDWAIRPNQVFALSLNFCPLEQGIRKSILDVVKKELLTPRGLRTLSAGDRNYRGSYTGNAHDRDMAYHQGTVWPWLIGAYIEASLRTKGDEAIAEVEAIMRQFEESVHELCLYTVPELYDGDYPHKAKGAVSQAWSVAELLRSIHMLKQAKREKPETIMEEI
jgi:predicted glycogen debranching enzyme